jgi:hypothetical protein
MATDIPRDLRTAVVARAQGQCEYCQIYDSRELNPYPHEIDHIIAEKHGGKTAAENLAYTCFPCNRHKGSDIASFDPQTGNVIQLFNPRVQKWDDHFRLDKDGAITGLTAEGRTTTALLQLNDPLRVQTRADLIAAGKLDPKKDE